jgi:hypothetical protein
MRSKRRMYKKTKKTSRRSKKMRRGGGFFDFFTGSKKVVPSQCDPNNLSQLITSQQLRENYQTCCPKTMFGMRKNNSPYCKQVELNAKAAVEREGMEKQFVGVDPLEAAEMKNAPMVPPAPAPAPPADQVTLMGGRRRRLTRRKSRRSKSRRRR